MSEASHRGRHVGRHRAGGSRPGEPDTRPLPFWQELPLLILIAFSLALLIKTFLLQAFFIPSGSMENTLLIKDRVLVNKIVYDFRQPQRGEVIVFRGVDSWAPEVSSPPPTGLVAKATRTVGGLVGLAEPDEKDFIKRVIGTPGDVVQCCDAQGRLMVNGKALDETKYLFEDDHRVFGPITVPEGRLFVMGDHRGSSQDSRAYISDQFKGTVPIDQVIGRAFVKVWPVARWGGLSIPEVWGSVPLAGSSPQVQSQPGAQPGAEVPPAVGTGGGTATEKNAKVPRTPGARPAASGGAESPSGRPAAVGTPASVPAAGVALFALPLLRRGRTGSLLGRGRAAVLASRRRPAALFTRPRAAAVGKDHPRGAARGG